MKLSHLALFFVIIFITIIIMTDIRTDNLTVVAEARNDMDFYLNRAMESAVDTLKQVENESIEISDLDQTADCFFSSMYASLGILSDPVAQERFRAYVPVIAITAEDGFYIMYNDEYIRNDGRVYITRQWTEFNPYYYQDDNFIYRLKLNSDDIRIYDINYLLGPAGGNQVYNMTVDEARNNSAYATFRSIYDSCFLLNQELYQMVKQQAVIGCLERELSWYISRHNEIAENYGITYQFSLPVTDESDWEQTMEGPGIIVAFQGMPLTEGSERTYNRIAFSGAGLRKDQVFYIEQKSWYNIYHRANCPLLEGNLNIRDEHYYSVEECSKIGCYACPICDPAGVHAPDYSP